MTKPIGVGIMTTALKRGLLDDNQIKRVTKVMTTLNKSAAEIMEPFNVHACTDVTGFGLLGHATEMAMGAQAGLCIYRVQVPVLEGVRELAEEGVLPGGSKNNHAHVLDKVTFPEEMELTDQYLLCDAVASGGLLMSVAQEDDEEFLAKLKEAGLEASIIGEVIKQWKRSCFYRIGEIVPLEATPCSAILQYKKRSQQLNNGIRQ